MEVQISELKDEKAAAVKTLEFKQKSIMKFEEELIGKNNCIKSMQKLHDEALSKLRKELWAMSELHRADKKAANKVSSFILICYFTDLMSEFDC